MSDNSEKDLLSAGGISRRDLLKIIGTGAAATLLAGCAGTMEKRETPTAKGKGLIFIVCDGTPIGTIRAMNEISKRGLGRPTSNIYRIMNDPKTAMGFMGTASLSSIVTDSSCAAVAWTTGSKTANRLMSILPDGRELTTIMELLKPRGYSCGLVTTTRITHATPAAWVSHSDHRDKEDNIALDYFKFKPDVLLGGGTNHFSSKKRKDGRDLFKEFGDAGYDVVQDRKALLDYSISSSKKPLLGTFNSSHLSYYVDRMNNKEFGEKQPGLPEMTQVALEKLSRNPQGFILCIEAGRIDHANHSNDAWSSITDTLELDDTIAVVEKYVEKNPETLVIITPDHGCGGFGFAGTGPDYYHSTEGLLKYMPITSSFEVMMKKLKDKSAAEIKDIFEQGTSFQITAAEAAMVQESMAKDYMPFPGDYNKMPDAMLGRLLAHSIYKRGAGEEDLTVVLRRGNVGFVSCTHTGEDQMVIAFGNKAREQGIERYFENTYLFEVMCKYFGVTHKNPTMTEEQAKPFIKVASAEEWARHMKLHVA